MRFITPEKVICGHGGIRDYLSAKQIGFGIGDYLFKSANPQPMLNQRARFPVFASHRQFLISPVQANVAYRVSFPVIAALPNCHIGGREFKPRTSRH